MSARAVLNTTRAANAGGALLLVILATTSSACMAGIGGMGLRTVMGGGTRPSAETLAPYSPTLTLPESARTIEARIPVDSFVSRLPADATDAKRRDDVTASVDGHLPELIRQAIARDLRGNLVFSDVRIHQEHPDLVLRGVIYQFAEYRSTPWYARLPLVEPLTGASERVEGGVRLELTLSTPDGRFVKVYQGQSVFPDVTSPTPGVSTSLGRPQVGPGPLRIDDELEGIQLLMARAQPVEGAPAQIGQCRAGGIVHEAQVHEL
jgi:hypothetical protein